MANKKKYYVTVEEHGTTRWYKDAACKVLHRENGPAIEYFNGTKVHYQNGLRHRINGAAVERSDGSMEWYIDGRELTEAEFLAFTKPVVELTLADIEKLVGKKVKIIA